MKIFNYRLSFLLLLLFLSISCGSQVVSVQPTPSAEFQQWKEKVSSMTAEKFVEWWNLEGNRGWSFSYYRGINDPNSSIVWPDTDRPEKIFESKIINCYRISILLQSIYGGQLVTIAQPQAAYDDVVLLLSENGKFSYIGSLNLELHYRELKAKNYSGAITEIKETYNK